jgi:hypothetical protein
MQRFVLASTFVLAGFFGAACAEKIVICDVVWSDANDTEVGTGVLEYDGDDVDAALADCKEDQMTHEERPDTAVQYNCNCSS